MCRTMNILRLLIVNVILAVCYSYSTLSQSRTSIKPNNLQQQFIHTDLGRNQHLIASRRDSIQTPGSKSSLEASTGSFLPTMRPNDDYNVKIEAPSFNSRRISANIVIDGTIDDVWSILTDYNNLATHVPNLVQSYLVPGPPGSIRLFQEGAQRIIGFDFRASVTMDMIEEPVDTNRALQERQLSFKLVDSLMFSSFEGSWNLRYHSRTPKVDRESGEMAYQYKTLLTYSVFVRPKGPVPVVALEWRIKEDIPTNLEGMKAASEKIAASRRNKGSSQGGGGGSRKIWGTDETLGLYMVNSRRGVNRS